MKEITFLKQNSKKWEEYEATLENKESIKPSKVAEMFIELTDDYSYSKSNFKESKTTSYLNSLTAKIHQLVYKNKSESNKRVLDFWKKELPKLFGEYHNLYLLSFIVAIIGLLIGIFSQLYDDSFLRLITGDNYVDETLERIKNGDPIGIYGEMPESFMFVYITINNIKVSFFMLAAGIIFSFGAGFYLLYNFIMLGSFLTLFYQYNVLNQALKVVWIHGAFEMSVIIIASCAGFILGNSFMFPDTHSRLESFKRGAKDSVKIVAGLIPFFICAGFLESFVTRYTNMDLWLSLTIILSSFGFIIFYFIYLPIRLNYKNYANTKN
jgi:uncharacterized membrane protein SpoIIM required for sporulation